MNDITLLREAGPAAPPLQPAARSAARVALLDEIERSRTVRAGSAPGSPARGRRSASAPGVTVAAVAWTAAVVIAAPDELGPPPGSVTLVAFEMPTFPLSLDPVPAGLRPAFDGERRGQLRSPTTTTPPARTASRLRRGRTSRTSTELNAGHRTSAKLEDVVVDGTRRRPRPRLARRGVRGRSVDLRQPLLHPAVPGSTGTTCGSCSRGTGRYRVARASALGVAESHRRPPAAGDPAHGPRAGGLVGAVLQDGPGADPGQRRLRAADADRAHPAAGGRRPRPSSARVELMGPIGPVSSCDGPRPAGVPRPSRHRATWTRRCGTCRRSSRTARRSSSRRPRRSPRSRSSQMAEQVTYNP